MVDLGEIVRCPRCSSRLVLTPDSTTCVNTECAYSAQGFPSVDGQPVLIDFEQSIFERESYAEGNGSVLPRESRRTGVKELLYRLIDRDNPVAATKCRDMLARLKVANSHPVVLVIGGGRIGNGAAALYEDAAVRVIGTDVYASPNTMLLADGHQLPFASNVFDGVWIQAVLEHVLEPQTVVDEIHRVLKPRGLVYADTPFMQQVHEGAYDFTRFTHSGHRWLFRRFEEIEAGVVAGAGEATLWSLRYLAHAIGLGHGASRLVALPFVWVRLLERFMNTRANLDAANAVYFLGVKTDRALSPKQLGEYYKRYARQFSAVEE